MTQYSSKMNQFSSNRINSQTLYIRHDQENNTVAHVWYYNKVYGSIFDPRKYRQMIVNIILLCILWVSDIILNEIKQQEKKAFVLKVCFRYMDWSMNK